MDIYYAKTPAGYQEYFCRQAGLCRMTEREQERIWEGEDNGYIRSFGEEEQIQFRIGSYTVQADFLVEYQYDIESLRFGIIYEGSTYSLGKDKPETRPAPSFFLTVERARGGVNCWKKGQRFKGLELSVNMAYLKRVILPFLGIGENTLSFLQENVRYTFLPGEMETLILRAEQLLLRGRLTIPLQMSICMEFIALLCHPENLDVFNGREVNFSKYVSVGTRRVRITREDFRKIVLAHDRIEKDAAAFFTIYELSREVGISEQKLKAGFKEMYRQTIWDYANSVRMHTAVILLQSTDLGIGEIAGRVGYQSQAAFTNTFKKWCGVTPGQFRIQGIGCDAGP